MVPDAALRENRLDGRSAERVQASDRGRDRTPVSIARPARRTPLPCPEQGDPMTEPRTRILADGWTVAPLARRLVPEPVTAAGRIPAGVPGVVHLDLIAAGLLDDPYLDTNEKAQEWVGSTSWGYATDFDWHEDGAERTDLVFLGLDTIATVRLNGAVVLESRNQHRSYRVPVRGRLREGPNRLEVDFAAPVPEADRASLALEYRPHVNHHPYNAIRKMACSFGWDWGIDTATSGIWKDVVLQEWSSARIESVRPVMDANGTTGTASVFVRIDGGSGEAISVQARLAGHTV